MTERQTHKQTQKPAQDLVFAKDAPHLSVMLREVLAALAPEAGKRYTDGTFGAGGYSRAILESADCRVIAIDRDISAVQAGREMAEAFGGRLLVIEGRFGEMDRLLQENGIYILETMNTGPLVRDNVTEFMFVLGQARIRGTVQMIINPVALY